MNTKFLGFLSIGAGVLLFVMGLDEKKSYDAYNDLMINSANNPYEGYAALLLFGIVLFIIGAAFASQNN